MCRQWEWASLGLNRGFSRVLGEVIPLVAMARCAIRLRPPLEALRSLSWALVWALILGACARPAVETAIPQRPRPSVELGQVEAAEPSERLAERELARQRAALEAELLRLQGELNKAWLAENPSDEDFLMARFEARQTTEAEREALYWHLMREGRAEIQGRLRQLAARQEGFYRQLRERAWQHILAGDQQAWAAYWRAFEDDPRYDPRRVDVLDFRPERALEPLGGGSTVSLKYKVSGSNVAAIKPDQDLRQTMYRSEIAYFRLCEILSCSFYVPENRAVRFKEADFDRLYQRARDSKREHYRSKFAHLIWVKEGAQRYLYATFKEWLPAFALFPIENTKHWQLFLRATSSMPYPELATLMQSLYSDIWPGSTRSRRGYLPYLEGLTSEQLLKQISELLLMDFLSNNWDRFSGDIGNYGANCQIMRGGLVALDNGAAFPPWHAPRVQRRLLLTQRFSREMVARLRQLDPSAAWERLFPEPSRDERRSLERFAERRQEALAYIDGLIARYGEEAVLSF